MKKIITNTALTFAVLVMICITINYFRAAHEAEVTETVNTGQISFQTSTELPADSAELPLQDKVICVDAGHGISSVEREEPIAPGSEKTKSAFVAGTTGKNQTEEQLNLRLALLLEKVLKEYGATVHMTRTTHETTLSNIDRAELANSVNADICVKIHADGAGVSSVHGISMLVPSNENLKNESVCNESKKAGEKVLDWVIRETGAKNNGVIKRSDLTGFNWSKVPVILIETGFMTNPEEDALLETDEYCGKLVTGIVNGLLEYFG